MDSNRYWRPLLISQVVAHGRITLKKTKTKAKTKTKTNKKTKTKTKGSWGPLLISLLVAQQKEGAVSAVQ